MNDLRKAAEMALEALECAYRGKDRAGQVIDAIVALEKALAQPEQEWDSRHPKAQALLRERARLRIELRLVEQLVDDPHFETMPTDMEYWGPLHDKLKEALTQEEKPPVKTYCGGKPNYCTPQPEVCCGEYARCLKVCIPKKRWFAQQKLNVDAVNMTPNRVDETAKGEHEPFIYIREDTEMPFGGYEHCGQHDPGAFPVYLAPPKREWVGLTDEEVRFLRKRCSSHDVFAKAIEAKLREKNS